MPLCFRLASFIAVDGQYKALACMVIILINSSLFYHMEGGIPDYSVSLGITLLPISAYEWYRHVFRLCFPLSKGRFAEVRDANFSVFSWNFPLLRDKLYFLSLYHPRLLPWTTHIMPFAGKKNRVAVTRIVLQHSYTDVYFLLTKALMAISLVVVTSK